MRYRVANLGAGPGEATTPPVTASDFDAASQSMRGRLLDHMNDTQKCNLYKELSKLHASQGKTNDSKIDDLMAEFWCRQSKLNLGPTSMLIPSTCTDIPNAPSSESSLSGSRVGRFPVIRIRHSRF